MKTGSIYQDRLGTNIGKANFHLLKRGVFLQAVKALEGAIASLSSALDQQTNQAKLTTQLTTLRQKAMLDLAHASAGEKAAAMAGFCRLFEHTK